MVDNIWVQCMSWSLDNIWHHKAIPWVGQNVTKKIETNSWEKDFGTRAEQRTIDTHFLFDILFNKAIFVSSLKIN